MKRKILVVFVVCLGLMALIPNNIIGETVTYTYSDDYDHDTYIIENSPDTNKEDQNYLCVYNETGQNCTTLIYFPDVDIDFQNTSINLFLWGQNTPTYDDGNVSIYRLTTNYTVNNATWNDKYMNTAWTNPGGDYNATEIDTNYITSTTEQWYNWDVTSFYWDVKNGTYNNTGFLLKVNPTDTSNKTGFNFHSSNSTNTPYLNITYIDGSGQTTNLYVDVWNLKGFAGESPKLASVIYSEISNCTALSWKNATTGYWYTYYPSLGLTEDSNLSFGDGLFILTDLNTTWDHT